MTGFIDGRIIVYECLNNGERSYQVLIQKDQGKDKVIKNTYSVKKKILKLLSLERM